jgi:hypothetical protein
MAGAANDVAPHEMGLQFACVANLKDREVFRDV